jgi:hypothetical protein
VGNNSDGIALNNRKLGPAVLTFPNGAPKVSPLTTNVGAPAKARIIAVGTPSGFVGTQYKPKAREDVPTVWLDGKPYVLPVVRSSRGIPIPSGMDGRQITRGLRIDLVGYFRHGAAGGNGPYSDGADYWLGKPSLNGFTFVERSRFVRSQRINPYGISTDGSMIFGVNAYEEGLLIYFTTSQRQISGGLGCGTGRAWGDSHGDILIDGTGKGLCLAQPKH